jgi:lipopolysaccharide/colanic/teichoic acid biosynthesis glycosyltransferase
MSGISHDVGARRLSWAAPTRRANAVWSILGDRVGGALTSHSDSIKRILDLLLATASLVVLLPLLAVVAIAVRADGRGPVLSRETRIGRGGEPFARLRFRTTRVDGRGITRTGRILRSYGIDGLPQLFSVVAGTMSLVGPRAPLPAEARAVDDQLERRLTGRPGLTGLWRVNGRHDLGWADSARLDLYYVENRTTTVDLLLLARTLVGLSAERAPR